MERVSAIILCEGETDQILLGSYLEKKNGWVYLNSIKDSPFPNEFITFFKNDAEEIRGIWPVGGNDFVPAIKSIIERETDDHLISKLVIVTDHDETEGLERFSTILQVIKNALGSRLKNNVDSFSVNSWNTIRFDNVFEDISIGFLFLLIPLAENGALETFMLNALSEQSLDKEYVITESRRFVAEFHSDVYLKQRREKTKAELGVSLSVFTPDKVFTTMKELLDSVDWSRFAIAREQFGLFDGL